MRGGDERSGALFSYVDLEARVGKDHPLRTIRGAVNEALASLSGEFAALYAPMGRPSIPPEKLVRAMLLQAFYTIRSERQLMERLEFDLLFRWFVGIGVDDVVWDHSTFSKNRERLLEGDIAAKLLSAVLSQPGVKRLLSTDHFSVDGTLVEAWASMKSFRPKDGEPPAPGGGRNRGADFHGQKRSNATHASTTDPQSLRPGDADDHRARRRNRLRRLRGRPRSRIRSRTRSASAGPDPTKTTKSTVKELPNSSKTAPSKSSSPMKTATKPPSRRNETLLQHPARGRDVACASLRIWVDVHGLF